MIVHSIDVFNTDELADFFNLFVSQILGSPTTFLQKLSVFIDRKNFIVSKWKTWIPGRHLTDS